jgi:AAA ATPase domain
MRYITPACCDTLWLVRIRPIAVNPGGLLDPSDIVGRDADRERICATLERRSVVLTGERRMGKTSLARLVGQSASQAGWSVVRQSAEGLRSLDELADELVGRLESAQGPLRKVGRTLREAITVSAGPLNIDFGRGPNAFERVVEAAVAAADDRLLLVLDELPLFARLLNQRDDGSGTEALHLLRRLREQHRGLRMLCLGSVGFHHVVRASASGVLNDTDRDRLLPLSQDMAVYLARCLFVGSGLNVEEPDAVAAEIAEQTEGIPYYVHRVVEAAERRGDVALVPGAATELVTAALTAPDDPWDLRHYRDRLRTYFGDDARLAGAALDVVAESGGALDLDGVADGMNVDPRFAPIDREHLRDMLERLEDDHYLVREGAARRFAFNLVRRAWVELRR